GNGDLQGQDAGVVAGSDVLGVEVVAEDQLAAEHTARPLGGDQLGVAGSGRSLGPAGDHVAFDVQIDRVGVDAGQVELDMEGVAVAPRIHRHDRRPGEGAGGAEDLLGD